jgi:hypothetical protein
MEDSGLCVVCRDGGLFESMTLIGSTPVGIGIFSDEIDRHPS